MARLEFYKPNDRTGDDGVFIPQSDLVGMSADEITDGVLERATSKAIFSLVQTFHQKLTDGSLYTLGFTASKGVPAGISPNVINQTFGFSIQKFADLRNHTIGELPLPNQGQFNGKGAIHINDFFPNAVALDRGIEVPGYGILVPTGEPFIFDGNVSQDSIQNGFGNDHRDWIGAVFAFLILSPDFIRSTSKISAVVSGSSSSSQIISMPADYIQSVDPRTSISDFFFPANPNQANYFVVLQKSFSITIQLLLDFSGQVFDVNAVTS